MYQSDYHALGALTATLGDAASSGKLADVELGPPVPRPGNCYAVGLNYRNHAVESKLPIPDVPMVFSKYNSCITGPTANIEMRSDYIDYEAELVAVKALLPKTLGITSPGCVLARIFPTDLYS